MCILALQKKLYAAKNSTIAAAQSAYMRHQFPFLGIPTPLRRSLQKSVFSQAPPCTKKQLVAIVQQLFELPEREFQYVAIDLAKQNLSLLTLDDLPLFEKMVRLRSWWDTVDEIASKLVGHVLYPEGHIDHWIHDSHLWIRRTALIYQLRWKKDTDEHRLFSHCLHLAHEKEFFIQKAIGWALREYAKHQPTAVLQFLKTYSTRLSPLSVREAKRHLLS